MSQQGRPEQGDRREDQSERTIELQHGHREAAQFRELRDILSCAGQCVAEAHESDFFWRAMSWEERDEDLDG